MATRSKMKAVQVSSEQQSGTTQPGTFQGRIVKDLSQLTAELLAKVKSDAGRGANLSSVLAELFMWVQIRNMADGQYERLLEVAKRSGAINVSDLETGTHVAAESRHFVVTVAVTEPVRRFDPDVLSAWAHKAYNVPVPLMKEQIELAKVPTKPQRRIVIAERP
jgi:hypothetical protein